MIFIKHLVVRAAAGLGAFLCVATHAEVAVVLNSGEGTISLIDTVLMKETKRLPIGKEPHHLMATPDDKFLIVANAANLC